MIATPCQADPNLWDVDRRMTRTDIEGCLLACRRCPILPACERYLADCDHQGVKVHGIIAAQHRPWPHKDGMKLTRCRVCRRLCATQWRRTHMPDMYGDYPRLASRDCCVMCWQRNTTQAAS